jgi:hypothetical protein
MVMQSRKIPMQITESDHLLPLRGAQRLFSSPRIDRELVTDFFMTFARTEYALKRAGYVEAGRSDEPRIKWDDFARSIGDTLLNSCSPAVAEAISYLSSNPPQKQVVRHRGLGWEPRTSDNPRDPIFLMRSITTVRNNLFHGGKEVTGRLAERDHGLVQSSLVILAHAIGLDTNVEHAFKELPPEQATA